MEWGESNLTEKKTKEPKEKIKRMILNFYDSQKQISKAEINQLKELLGEIPNLVINFDETITQEDTVIKMLKVAKENTPFEQKEFEERLRIFRVLIGREKARKDDVIPNISKIEYFYTQLLVGIDKDVINREFDKIVDNTEINENFGVVVKKIKEYFDVERIQLFVLSLNNIELITRFYNHPKIKKVLDELGVDIIGYMGNQIIYEDGKVKSVAENVSDENKHTYIPQDVIMLADVRETKEMIEKGVMAINIESGYFDNRVLKISLSVYLVEKIIIERSVGLKISNTILQIKNSINAIERYKKELKKDKKGYFPNKLLDLELKKIYDEIEVVRLNLLKEYEDDKKKKA